jgi:hypothetical protein
MGGSPVGAPIPHAEREFIRGDRSKRIFGLWGRRKSLKTFNPDKEIKVNSFAFLWPNFAGFGPGLAGFGFRRALTKAR